jgi:hypothetical protein
MYRRLILMTFAAALIGTASARTFEAVEGAYEAVLGDVTFPSSIAGTLIVKMCSTCEATALSVDAGTVYLGTNGRPLPLVEFLESAAALRQAPGGEQGSAVFVFYSLETNRVTRVSLHAGVPN